MERRSLGAIGTFGAIAVGLILLLLAGLDTFNAFSVSDRGFKNPATFRTYSCGSVSRPADPRGMMPVTAPFIPYQLVSAYRACEVERRERSSRARIELLLGSFLIVGTLAVPTVRRFRRRHRVRRKRPYAV